MAKKRRLGRGLDALLGEASVTAGAPQEADIVSEGATSAAQADPGPYLVKSCVINTGAIVRANDATTSMRPCITP